MAEAALHAPDASNVVPIVSFLVLTSVACFGFTLPFVHITLVTISSMSRQRQVEVPTWPSNVPIDRSMISGPIMLQPKTENSTEPSTETLNARASSSMQEMDPNENTIVMLEKSS